MSGEDTHQNPTVQPVLEEGVSPSDDFPELGHEPPQPRWRRFLVPGLIGVAILGVGGWLLLTRIILPIIMFSQIKPQLTKVPLANPKSATIDDSSDYAATLDSRQSVTLQPRVSGQISAIYVKAGDRVEAGASILQIDAAEQSAQVNSRAAAVETAAADVEAARADVVSASDTLRSLQARRSSALADVQLNQREYQRYQDLTNQGASSKQVLDQKLNALQTSQAALRQIEADIQAQRSAINRANTTVGRNQRAVQQAQANVSESAAQLQYYTITAPFAGVVGDIPVKEGDFANTTTQLLTITQNLELEVQIAVPLDKAAALRRGLTVKLLNDQDQELQKGIISFVSPNVDPATQSIQAKAVFKSLGKLRTAQFVRARVIWATRLGVLVPTTAISRLGGRDFIFIATPFKDSGCKEPAKSDFGGPTKLEPNQLVAAQKGIKLGKIVGNDQEVLEGVSQRDRIITADILQLQNCMPIAESSQPAKSP